LAEKVQEVTGNTGDVASMDQGYTWDQVAQDIMVYHIRLKVVKLSEAQKGVVLLPKRWVVERSNTWAASFRRLA
jgi:transposase